MAFRVGQKVVFIGNPNKLPLTCTKLENNKIYIIGGFCNKEHGGVVGIHLDGVFNTNDQTHCACYAAHRFRPIVEKGTETGMAILRKILTDTKVKEKV